MERGKIEKIDVDFKLKKQAEEERRLSEMMIPKKKRRLYQKIMYSKKRERTEVRKQLGNLGGQGSYGP